MLKLKAFKIAATVTAIIGLVAGLGLGTGTAVAAPRAQAAHASSLISVSAAAADLSANVPVQTVNDYRAPLYYPDGQLAAKLPAGTLVDVTCWYSGNPPAPYAGDGYMDHVVWVEGVGSFTGHVPDRYVNLGDETPPEYGFTKCG
jgi:hypothetical protein